MAFSKVRLHNDFLNGSKSSLFATDWPMLSSPQKQTIAQFVSDLSKGKNFEGVNKESWIDRHTCAEISNAEIYKKANAWHYHCGPAYQSLGRLKTPPTLDRNLDGADSTSAFHYLKINAETITIFGFSKNHVPFLNQKNFSFHPDHPFYFALLRKYNSSPI